MAEGNHRCSKIFADFNYKALRYYLKYKIECFLKNFCHLLKCGFREIRPTPPNDKIQIQTKTPAYFILRNKFEENTDSFDLIVFLF